MFFIQFCLAQNLGDLTKHELKKEIPTIQIKNLVLKKPNALPNNFSEYKLINAELYALNKNGGVMKVVYKKPNNSNKTMFIRFDLQAKFGAYIAKREIDREHLLNLGDYEYKDFDFSRYEKNILYEIPPQLVSKSKIKQNEILLIRHFKNKNDVLKGDSLIVTINDGDLIVQNIAIAQEDANIGDTISLKSGNQTIRAVVISKTNAEVR